MDVVVRLFGPEAQLTGARELTVSLDAPSPTVGELRAALEARDSEHAAHLAACRVAVNHEFAGDDQPIGEGDEVALIGQVSGG